MLLLNCNLCTAIVPPLKALLKRTEPSLFTIAIILNYCDPIMITLIYAGSYRYKYILPYLLIIEVYTLPPPPVIRRLPLCRSVIILFPPVFIFFFFIIAYFYHTHSRKMTCIKHICKRSMFISRSQCRCAAVFCLRSGDFL